MWNLDYSMGRQKVTERLELCREKIRRWAYNNALTLVFTTFMFGVTWTLMIYLAFRGVK